MKYYQKLTEEETVELLKGEFLESLKSPFRLYKGVTCEGPIGDFYRTKSSATDRPSKTESENGNFYNLMLNNLPSWKGLPQRRRSIIGCTSLEVASAFARPIKDKPHTQIFRLLPSSSASIAIAPKEDIWYCFRKALGALSLRGHGVDLLTLNHCWNEIITGCADHPGDSWASLIDCTRMAVSAGHYTQRLGFRANLLLQAFSNFGENLEARLDTIFSPDNNNFIVQQFSNGLNLESFTRNEIWMEGTTLLISDAQFDRLADRFAS